MSVSGLDLLSCLQLMIKITFEMPKVLSFGENNDHIFNSEPIASENSPMISVLMPALAHQPIRKTRGGNETCIDPRKIRVFVFAFRMQSLFSKPLGRIEGGRGGCCAARAGKAACCVVAIQLVSEP